MNIVLCVTGSVAASVTEKVVESLKEIGNVEVAITNSALRFNPHPMPSLDLQMKIKAPVYTDENEWRNWDEDKKVLHIQLKDWADVVVFAPLSANTLAKMAAGMCDNLVTCIFRACPPTMPIILAPAMNTDMWNNSITQENIIAIRNRYACSYYVQPVEKKLACGITGIGAMADAEAIAELTKRMMDNEG